jgi:hypothetical protein
MSLEEQIKIALDQAGLMYEFFPWEIDTDAGFEVEHTVDIQVTDTDIIVQRRDGTSLYYWPSVKDVDAMMVYMDEALADDWKARWKSRIPS